METTLNGMKPTELLKTLEAFYKQRNPKTIVLGSPGGGKTSVCYTLADEVLKVPRFTFQATLYDPVEIKGLPVFDHENNVARFLPFNEMPSLPEGILIIDDLPHAPTQTQNAFMRLVLEGVAGAWDLGGLYPIATGNRAMDRAGAKDMQTAMANRFCFLNLVIDYDDWRKWAVTHDIMPEIVAYLGTPYGKEYLDKFDPAKQINATPRSWEAVSNVMKCMKTNSAGLMKSAMFGCVGEEATLKFTGWLKYFEKMPDLHKIVSGKDIYPDELDVMYATVSGLVSLVKGFPKKQTILERLIEYSVNMPEKYVELGALLSKDLLLLVGEKDFTNAISDQWVERYPELIVGE